VAAKLLMARWPVAELSWSVRAAVQALCSSAGVQQRHA
jgi:hypothetical protein